MARAFEHILPMGTRVFRNVSATSGNLRRTGAGYLYIAEKVFNHSNCFRRESIEG
jgi:hypothetical protein